MRCAVPPVASLGVTDKKLPLRATLAASVSRTAAALSRATGRGDGSVIGGKLGMMIDPDLLAHLADGRRIALVSGTNGKTTTTRFTAAAVGVLGEVATNSFGANMPTGHTSALARAGSTPFAVLEVDEHYLAQVIKATSPRVVALLNLSRDQLDRAKEVAMMAQLWRDALAAHPDVHVVANADDPMVVYAAAAHAAGSARGLPSGSVAVAVSGPAPEALTSTGTGALQALDEAAPADPTPSDAAAALADVDLTASDAAAPADGDPTATAAADSAGATGPVADLGAAAAGLPGAVAVAETPFGRAPIARATGGVTWFSAGQRWRDDAHVCPACGAHIEREDDGDNWWCTSCDLRRPTPDWTIDGSYVLDPAGARHQLKLQLPGKVNIGNAATALAVASRFGVAPADAAPKLAEVASVAGRYAQVQRDGRNIRLLLAKNPASWLEAFEMAEDAPTLLSINARDPDGFDTSWLFDVDFAPLRGRQVVITGDRAYDLAVRLQVNEVPFSHVRSFSEALAAVPAGPLEVIANYTAFQDIRAELDRVV
jgi:UDP-N-acetylmuramyl tripeptide synthase